MRGAMNKLGGVAVFWSFSVVFHVTHGSVHGSILYPECPNAVGVNLPNTPCYGAQASQVHDLPNNQIPRVQQNWQQAMTFQQQPQMLNSMVQNVPVDNFRIAPRVYHGKIEGTERFKRQMPYQSSYSANQYGGYNPYQDGNMWQLYAGINSQALGLPFNAFQQTGLNQYGGNYGAYQQMSPTYNGYGDSSNWMGNDVQSDANSLSGFQMGQNLNGNSYGSSMGQYNQGSYTPQSNYPVRSCYCGYTYMNEFVPLCQMSCRQPEDSKANQQSQPLGVDQLKGQYASLQPASLGRSLEKSHTSAQASAPIASPTTTASVARNFENSTAPQQSLSVERPALQEAPVSHPSSQAALPIEAATVPTATAAPASVSQPPEPAQTTSPTEPTIAAPASVSQPPEPAQTTSPTEPPTAAPVPPLPPTPATPEVPPMPVPSVPPLTYAPTLKPIKAQRSILDE